ncbi:serine hydrolase domain-containing protein [Alsobacter sp. R-9]
MALPVIADPRAVGLCPDRLSRIVPWMRRYVDEGKLPGLLTLVMRRGEIAWLHVEGRADVGRGVPLREDAIFRIYSMTKPLTSVAVMMLYERGLFQLDDPIHRFLPCFRDMRVFVDGSPAKWDSVPAQRPITFRDLLTHTSGLTYGFMEAHPVDALYRARDINFSASTEDLGVLVERLAALPLLSQPGTRWNYSVATDVLGHLVAVISGRPFEAFLHEEVLSPLGMVDTGFTVPEASRGRLTANYAPGPAGLTLIDDPADSLFSREGRTPSGGGGLVSTAADYARFCRFLLNKGELDGTRLLGRKTVELMMANHLDGDIADMGKSRFSESTYVGIGFGLGFSVMLDPARAQILGTPGEVAWGGAASTAFWVNPAEDMAVIMLTQLMPSSTWPIRRELRVLTYQAIVD